jgi:D-sedoheptulose 7-phosphate isomerase
MIEERQRDCIKTHLVESAKVKHSVAEMCIKDILDAVECISQAFLKDGKLMLCGNGGSAADCQHVAGEFMCRLSKDFDRPALPALALTTDTSFITAFSNDYSFDGVFERQVQAWGKPGDVLMGISTSGNSANIIRAFKIAKIQNLSTIALVGSKGEMASLADISISIPSDNTQYIQESMLAIEHLICELVERKIYKQDC